MTTTTIDDFYCSQKFTWLSVDLEKSETLSCCSASPQKIDFAWLSENSGKLFNTPKLHQERIMMLENKQVPSCQSTCWNLESAGIVSRRISMGSNARTHTTIESNPEVLNLMLGKNCNMSCSYCCKQYSTAWTRDIATHGPYKIPTQDDRYELNKVDQILLNLSQKELSQSKSMTQLIDEIAKMSVQSLLKQINISGGEPFLYLNLSNLVNAIPEHIPIIICSGLGVDSTRLTRELDKIKHRNIRISISCENTNNWYEFNRYGNTWQKFCNNIEIIKQNSIEYSFNSVVSNLTVFDLDNFINFAGASAINYSPCTDPDFLSVHVLDTESKNFILSKLDQLPLNVSTIISKSLDIVPTKEQHQNLKLFVHEFSKRRGLTLDWLPDSFKTWLAK